MSRILAIDYGAKRIGLAISDPLNIISTPFEVWENKGLEDFITRYFKLKSDKKIIETIVGLPKNMDGTIGFQAQEVIDFFEKIEDDFIFVDERLSSKTAEQILYKKNYNSKQQRGLKDSYAAHVILENHLLYRR